MTTEDDAQLRYLIRQLGQLPQPDKDILGRVSKKFSVLQTGQKQRILRDVSKQNLEAEQKAQRRKLRFDKSEKLRQEEEAQKKARQEKRAARKAELEREEEAKAARRAARKAKKQNEE